MIKSLYPQLPLHFPVRDEFTFDNYIVGNNRVIIEQLLQATESASGQFVYLWGKQGVGCSHLLQACCHQAGTSHRTSMYLPLDELIQYDASAIEGIETVDLVCIDHLEVIAGQKQWETALFHLFNRLVDSGSGLVIASTKPVRLLDVNLADLVSRLSSCLVYQVVALDDDDLLKLLQQRARPKGIELNADVARFIINRCERSVPGLLAVLERLDHNALSAGRRVTVPFIKYVMQW